MRGDILDVIGHKPFLRGASYSHNHRIERLDRTVGADQGPTAAIVFAQCGILNFARLARRHDTLHLRRTACPGACLGEAKAQHVDNGRGLVAVRIDAALVFFGNKQAGRHEHLQHVFGR